MSQLPSQFPPPAPTPHQSPLPQPPSQGNYRYDPSTVRIGAPPRPARSKRILISSVIGALVVAGGGVGLYLGLSGGSSHPATGKSTTSSSSVTPKTRATVPPAAATTAPQAGAPSEGPQDANVVTTDSYAVAVPSGYTATTSGTETDMTAADSSVGITVSAAGTPASTAGESLQTVAGQVASNLVSKLNVQVVAGSESDLTADTAQDPAKLFKLASATESDLVVVFEHGQQFWAIVLYGPPASIDVASGAPVAALSLVTGSMAPTS